MKCPNCGLVNPESAAKCDCGFDFLGGGMEQVIKNPKKRGKPFLIFWHLLMFIVIALVTYTIMNSFVHPLIPSSSAALQKVCKEETNGMIKMNACEQLMKEFEVRSAENMFIAIAVGAVISGFLLLIRLKRLQVRTILGQ